MKEIKGERWGSRIGLIFAVAGNAVGLGNFLRFPAQAAQNGGGAFIIPYLVAFLLMGIPLLWVEWAIGRHGGKYGYNSTPGMFHKLGKGKYLKYIGVFGIFNNLVIAAYYCYIESWTLAYVWHSLAGTFTGLDSNAISAFFSTYLNIDNTNSINIPGTGIIFFILTLGLNLWILSKGLSKGIEIVSKIALPALLLFGVILAMRAFTLDAGESGAVYDAMTGFNFLWTPKFESLSDPKVWLAAAGQIFFTLSVGMGSIHCYASYLREKDDIALNASAAGWMNEFVEIILGASIVIPISAAYLGLEWVRSNVGFEMGFRTMPSLFQNWGPVLSVIAGVVWFGLLFFAGITSSLAMGQPVMAFFQQTLNQSRKKSAVTFGILTLLLALPCILFYRMGVFGEFDYWAGTFALVVFATAEMIIFAWVFGIENAWGEIRKGADMSIPMVYKFVLKYITPIFLIAVLVGSTLKPATGDWILELTNLFNGDGWNFAADSVVGTILHIGSENLAYFSNGTPTDIFIKDISRLLLSILFISLSFLTYRHWKKEESK